jgi:hypothetical protein
MAISTLLSMRILTTHSGSSSFTPPALTQSESTRSDERAGLRGLVLAIFFKLLAYCVVDRR